MPNQCQKKKKFYNIPVYVFTSACTYISENILKESITLYNDMPRSKIEQILDFYKKKAAYNYVTPLELIEDSCFIEQQICEYVVQITKKDGSEYKTTTIK
ncbi:8469_t:CDS:2 [Cetraspora pellucida]|uniref:8469_t:CDS:1 n=1 Tax=Cetraspora pellucida TaxID=1433469 RepID=A0ACA9NMT4_9GLOM|nr:8469_t:CDS:2 [Cetraspora pellucida]